MHTVNDRDAAVSEIQVMKRTDGERNGGKGECDVIGAKARAVLVRSAVVNQPLSMFLTPLPPPFSFWFTRVTFCLLWVASGFALPTASSAQPGGNQAPSLLCVCVCVLCFG